jgi:outer membrane immunogenic protein
MKRFFLATTALVMLSVGGPAIAADMAVKARPLPPPPPACAQFGGFFLGGNVGGAYYDHQYDDRDGWATDSDTQLPQNVRPNKSGFIGGVGGGYNWQSRCTVFGIEADYSWTNLNANKFFTDSDAGAGLDTLSVSSRLRGVGTVRARTGIVVDNVLLYVTGGLAWGTFDRTHALTDNVGGVFVTETFSSRKTKWGWTLGVGTEWAAWDNWSIKSEFLYARFESDTVAFTSVLNGPPARNFDYQDNVWISRIGLNYRFNYGPVVARY